MKKIILIGCLVLILSHTQAQITYRLSYLDSSKKILSVKILFKTPLTQTFFFVMPRYIPGNYAGRNYNKYLSPVTATATDDSVLTLREDMGGPRWYISRRNKKPITSVQYTVNVGQMENMESLTDASVIRSGYAGLLNYSIFGFIGGQDTEALTCEVQTFGNWPVFSTILPKVSPDKGKFTFTCSNYYQLADGQTLMGPKLRVAQYKGLVPIYVTDYSEGDPDYLDDLGWEAVTSLSILKDYFKTIPFENYTVVKHAVKPQNGLDEEATFKEHMNSCTLLSGLRGVNSKPMDSAKKADHILGILHHMAHAYIPLRCYGDEYKPYVLEVPVFIRSIWFNEGFIWFFCVDATKNKDLSDFLKSDIEYEPMELKKLGLFDLSKLASLQYGDDFRIGVAIYSRGAMMAMELDSYIKEKTGGKKSMRDAFQYLYQWAQKEKRPFTLEEFPGLLNQATGVDVSAIYAKWQLPLTDPIFQTVKN